jgi:hypothetical protein
MNVRIFITIVAMLLANVTFANDIFKSSSLRYSGTYREIPRDYFGIHFHRLVLSPGEKAIQTVWPPFNFGMVRLWDSRTRWADIEPQRGNWQFSRTDYYVNEATERNVKVLYTLGSTPRWASARPDEPCSYGMGCAAEPSSFEYWRQYVQTVVRRYRGRICCYELWNEPDFSGPPKDPSRSGGFYTGSASQMVEMARIASQVIREEDPNAMLLSPGFVNGINNRLEPFLAAGGQNYIQGVAYHFYVGNDESRLLRDIKTIRSLMTKYGVGNLPLWNTETGIEVYEPGEPLPPSYKVRITREEGAALMTRQIVLGAFAGLDHYSYYTWDNDKSGMVDRAGNFRPARDSMLLIQRWLLGAKLSYCEIDTARFTLCWGEKDSNPFAIIWTASHSDKLELPVPDGLVVTSRQEAVPRWISAEKAQLANNKMVATANPAFYQFLRK